MDDKSGTESNMSFGLPIRDDDRIEFRVAAREAKYYKTYCSINKLAYAYRISRMESNFC